MVVISEPFLVDDQQRVECWWDNGPFTGAGGYQSHVFPVVVLELVEQACLS